MTRSFALLLVIGLLVIPALRMTAWAEEEEQKTDPLALQAKTSIKIFRKEFKTKNMGKKMRALHDLARVNHELIIDELGYKPLGDRNEEVRRAVAMLLGDMTHNRKKAGEYLKKALMRNEDFPAVQRSIVIAIGKLGYMDAIVELKAAAAHLNEEKYQRVTIEVVRTFGRLEDKRSLPFLLWMSEYGGKVLKWSTGEVKVDKTRSGDADQREAEAKWKAKYGHVKPKKPPAPLIRKYMQVLQDTVKKLTGQKFPDATAFRQWLIEHAEELGLDPKDLDKD